MTSDERNFAIFAHLAALAGYILLPAVGWVAGPLVIWLIKKDQYPFVDQQGKEALNFNITFLIATIIPGLLTAFLCIGFLLLFPMMIFHIVVVIMAALKAKEGVPYRYPLTIRFLS